MRRAVARLDEKSRRFVELVFLQDEPPSYEEIAARLGIPVGSIGPTRARCLAQLRALLSETQAPDVFSGKQPRSVPPGAPDPSLTRGPGDRRLEAPPGHVPQRAFAVWRPRAVARAPCRPARRGPANTSNKFSSLRRDTRVRFAEPIFTGQTPEGRHVLVWAVGGGAVTRATQWAPQALALPQAQQLATGRNVRVAVLDTGADLAHPQRSARWATGAQGRVLGRDFGDDGAHVVNMSLGTTQHDGRLASFAIRGARVGLSAPGDSIISTMPGGDWAVWSGTSMGCGTEIRMLHAHGALGDFVPAPLTCP